MAASRELDHRAYAQETGEERVGRIRQIAELRAEIERLQKVVAARDAQIQDDGRLLRGLTKLGLNAHYNHQEDLLTISPLLIHDDADSSYVWQLLKAKRTAEGR